MCGEKPPLKINAPGWIPWPALLTKARAGEPATTSSVDWCSNE